MSNAYYSISSSPFLRKRECSILSDERIQRRNAFDEVQRSLNDVTYKDTTKSTNTEFASILILPVSGGAFVTQLAILKHLCDVEYRPNITLASSGGNVAAYVASCSDWKSQGIDRVSNELNSTYFAKCWHPLSCIAYFVGFLSGNLYKRGSGPEQFIRDNFHEDDIMKDEIWTGTYNHIKKKIRLFCNKNKSVLNMELVDLALTQCLAHVYMHGDVPLISKVLIASASIPTVVPPQKITINNEEEEYVDGGVAGASPLKTMQSPLIEYSKNKNVLLIYVSPIDLTCDTTTNNVMTKYNSNSDYSSSTLLLSQPLVAQNNDSLSGNMISNIRGAVSDMVRSHTINDRINGYEFLKSDSDTLIENIEEQTFTCCHENLLYAMSRARQSKKSLLEIYPIQCSQVDMINFNGRDVVDAINIVYGNCMCRLWTIKQ